MRIETWILGAPDPEESEIKAVLRDRGQRILYAACGGVRVHPGNAYRANGVIDSDGNPAGFIQSAVLVECGGPIEQTIGCYVHPDGSTSADGGCGDGEWVPGWDRVDHHRPGDPGHGKGPADFLSASAIGQVLARLGATGESTGVFGTLEAHGKRFHYGTPDGWSGQPRPKKGWYLLGSGYDPDGDVDCRQIEAHYIPEHLVLTAAADHCLAAAYAGQCPGVDTAYLAEHRHNLRALHQKRQMIDVLENVEAAARCLKTSPRVVLRSGTECGWAHDPSLCDGQTCGYACDYAGLPPITVADLRHGAPIDEAGRCCACSLPRHHADGYTTALCECGPFIPELPEAACQLGVAYLAAVKDRDGRCKVVLGGGGEGTTPGTAPVKAFIDVWGPAQGLTGIYGDPVRGFAGGYMQ